MKLKKNNNKRYIKKGTNKKIRTELYTKKQMEKKLLYFTKEKRKKKKKNQSTLYY